ncbi:MAG: hypothetical protein IBX72_09805 [Nitrospirae bacterium]|nr:hypothetical protein [Nitrospirota bacterium]
MKDMIILSPHLDSYKKFISVSNQEQSSLFKLLSEVFPIKVEKSIEQKIFTKARLREKELDAQVKALSGKILATDIIHPIHRTVIAKVGEELNQDIIEKAISAKIPEVMIMVYDSYDELRILPEKIGEIRAGGVYDYSKLKREESIKINFEGYQISTSPLTELQCFESFESLMTNIRLNLSIVTDVRWVFDGIELYHDTSTKSANRSLGSVPQFTDRSSFIINGIERVPVAQILRSGYGILIEGKRDSSFVTTYEAWVRPKRGRYLKFSIPDSGDDKWIILATIHGLRKPINLKYFLDAFDFMKEADEVFSDSSFYKLNKDEAILKSLGKRNITDTIVSQKDISFLSHHFFSDQSSYYLSAKGRQKLNEKLAVASSKHVLALPSIEKMCLTREDILSTVAYLFNLIEGESGYTADDVDNLANREVLLVGDHLEAASIRALRKIKQALIKDIRQNEEMSYTLSKMPVFFNSAMEDYANGELCQILDMTNPLSEISHKRKITFYGPGGLSKEYRGVYRRDVHYTHYGRICPVETPESEKIGLTVHLATYAKIEDGQIKTPIMTDKDYQLPANAVFMGPSDETLPILPKSEEKTIFARHGEKEMIKLDSPDMPHHQDAFQGQFLGIAASMIPFVQHDDANRVLMGAKNLKQALPLLKPEQPFVKTGMEKVAAMLSGRGIVAEKAGEVLNADEHEIIIEQEDLSKRTYKLNSMAPTLTETAIFHKPVVSKGDYVAEGQLIAEGAAMKDGELALGVNLLVAYMPWEGYNFEDGIVISDRLQREDILTSIHIKEVIVDIDEDEIAWWEAKSSSSFKVLGDFMQLNKDGYININTKVEADTVLVQKFKRYKEKKSMKKGCSLIFIKGESYVDKPILIKADDTMCGTIIKAEKRDIYGKQRIVIWILQERKVTVGDKLMGRHGNKGVISKILPMHEMPYFVDEEKGEVEQKGSDYYHGEDRPHKHIDIVLNPNGVISRMNLGQLLETHAGLFAKTKGIPHITVRPFEEYDIETLKGELDSLGFSDGKATLYDGETARPFKNPVTVGYQYIVKLNHLSEEKVHTRLTGRYTTIIQQAPRGKENEGGQRIGEMEVWALLAHKAFVLLQELLSIKSDDVEGRLDAMEKMKNLNVTKMNFGSLKLQRHMPESFRVLLLLLHGLAIKPVIHLTDGTSIEDFEYTPSFTVDQMSELSLHRNDEGAKCHVTESRYRERLVYGEISCGCRGYFKDILLSRNPLICRKHGREVKLSCGCEGNLLNLTEHTNAGFKCKKHKEVVKFSVGKQAQFYSAKDLKEDSQIIKRLGNLIQTEIYGSKEQLKTKKEMGKLLLDVMQDPKFAEKVLEKKPQLALTNDLKMLVERVKNIHDRPFSILKTREKNMVRNLNRKLLDKAYPKGLQVVWQDEQTVFTEDGIFSQKIFGREEKKRRETIDFLNLAMEMGYPLSRTTSKDGGYKYALTIKKLPIIPPELRPLLLDESGGSELNRLYQRVIAQNIRLKDILEMKKRGENIPQNEIDEEVQELQSCLDQLMVDGLEDSGKVYRSLMDMLNGKYGLFRQAMLGKRVDASGRAVIVPAPHLSITQMELPFKMALELFKPWIPQCLIWYSENLEGGKEDLKKLKIKKLGRAQAEGIIALHREPLQQKMIKDAMQEWIKANDLVVLLNRAPSLHKYNILAFSPVITDNPTIGLHPLVCTGFNADFDGDQMAVFLPWIGQDEARERLTPLRNVLSSANGSLLLDFSQDIVAGLFLLENKKKKEIIQEMKDSYLTSNKEKFAEIANKKMLDGFSSATKTGLTFSLFDLDPIMVWEKERDGILSEVVRDIGPYDQLSQDIKEKVVDFWKIRVKDKIAEKMNANKENPIAVMSSSGARGDLGTITQLAGMRGFMVKTGGSLSEEPVRTNFREGLSPLEFFISTHGSRKSLVDKKLKVAEAGDFTRRLVHSAIDYCVVNHDCGTKDGIHIEDIDPLSVESMVDEALIGQVSAFDYNSAGIKRGRSIKSEDIESLREIGINKIFIWASGKVPFRNRIVGRVLMQDIPGGFIKAGEVIGEEAADKIEAMGINRLLLRSVMTCKAQKGFCQKCYGWELSMREYPEIGLPVGVIAAESIGERGTQLSMRTFHTGGVKGEDITQGLPRVKNIFENKPIPLMVFKILKPGDSPFAINEEVDELKLFFEVKRIESENGEIPSYEKIGTVKKSLGELLEEYKSLDNLVLLLLREMHAAYKGEIADKHFEIILKSMFKAHETGYKLVGLTHAAATADFLSSASFQRAKQVFKDAVKHKGGLKTSLSGLRDAIMLGRLPEREEVI